MPALKLSLTPWSDQNGAIQYLQLDMIVKGNFPKKNGDLIFRHTLQRGPTPTVQYTADDILVLDTRGQIPVSTNDEPRRRNFHLARDIEGDELRVSSRAYPREVEEDAQCGPQVGLNKEGKGLTGSGLTFILDLVPVENLEFDIEISWDLAHVPAGTRTVCSLGEGPAISVKKKLSLLQEIFFAVAPELKSYPPSTIDSAFGIYWIDEPDFDVVDVGHRMQQISKSFATFFQDSDDTYRIFVRHARNKCASGSGLYRGFAFSWTSIIRARDAGSATEFLAHEAVHNWPRLQSSGDLAKDYKDGWFNEGIADYYSLVLPHYLGVFTEQEFVQRLNIHLSGYYTNPDRHTKNTEIFDNFWKGGHINRIPYQRGFMYFLRLSYQLHHGQGRNLDELIRDMVQRRQNDRPHTIQVWLSLVEAELGPQALGDYNDMSDAKLIRPPSDILDMFTQNKWRCIQQDQEEFSIGFPEDCFSNKPPVVTDLDLQSRAAEAGLQEGDILTQKHTFFWAAEDWGSLFSLVVKRRQPDGTEKPLELTWSPRSKNKVESYQFVLDESIG